MFHKIKYNLLMKVLIICQGFAKHIFVNNYPLNYSSSPNIIEYYRREAGIKQQSLAEQFGVTQGAISQAIFDYKNKYTNSILRANIIATINKNLLHNK